jgi:hypothetical protein
MNRRIFQISTADTAYFFPHFLQVDGSFLIAAIVASVKRRSERGLLVRRGSAIAQISPLSTASAMQGAAVD